ncbi:MAG: 4-hydroxythreonine-4-phosphate dehydrogenase PdxA [Betaproteobacteria bacterium]|nr:MAG: 4-hydroxythreonine-4-phosphate dehydrogenase PdxA [Betaproteobacteria bacterium]
MGDPAGVGPEIIIDALCEFSARPVVVFGERAVLERAKRMSPNPRASALELTLVETSVESKYSDGIASAASGRASIASIEGATQACLSGDFAALITTPINKTALRLAGSSFPGHTEMLASLCGDRSVAMMFASNALNVMLVTIHLSLRDAIDAISTETVARAIQQAHDAAPWLSINGQRPRIAVAGLNPHASEDGLFGQEEALYIEPAIRECQMRGIDVSGPYPPDTIFMRAKRGEFDIVVAMTHDHGLIAVKLDGIDHAVNVTVGLPFLRASVDHGTAYDIAWRGAASSKNLLHVLNWAHSAISK